MRSKLDAISSHFNSQKKIRKFVRRTFLRESFLEFLTNITSAQARFHYEKLNSRKLSGESRRALMLRVSEEEEEELLCRSSAIRLMGKIESRKKCPSASGVELDF